MRVSDVERNLERSEDDSRRKASRIELLTSESKTEKVKMECEISSLEREIFEKSEMLAEMEKSSAKALDAIIRLEKENKDILNDFDWVKDELKSANDRWQQEHERNEDLLNANR